MMMMLGIVYPKIIVKGPIMRYLRGGLHPAAKYVNQSFFFFFNIVCISSELRLHVHIVRENDYLIL